MNRPLILFSMVLCFISCKPNPNYLKFDSDVPGLIFKIFAKSIINVNNGHVGYCEFSNDDELYEVSKAMGSKYNSLEQNLMYIANKTNTKHICVTKGHHGAVLLYNDKLYYNSGYLIKVIDTVGAGDSFLGSLISQLLNKVNPQEAIDFACAVGAMVAQNEGANPVLLKSNIDAFINPYQV